MMSHKFGSERINRLASRASWGALLCFFIACCTQLVASACLAAASGKHDAVMATNDISGSWTFTRTGGRGFPLEGKVQLHRDAKHDDKREGYAAFFGHATYVDKASGKPGEQDWLVHIRRTDLFVQAGGQVQVCHGKIIDASHFTASCKALGFDVGMLDVVRSSPAAE